MTQSTTTGFGIDLAGYSTGKSGFAKAVRSGASIDVTIYRNHALAVAADGINQLVHVTEPEVELLENCLRYGRTLIDIPIDLQELFEPRNTIVVWQLTKRPVDFCFSALPPLADKIGSPVARIRNLLQCIRDRHHESSWGERNLFETYPAGSLELLMLPRTGYKNQRITFIDEHWRGETLAAIANSLRIKAQLDTSLNDDDVDACICAITGVVDQQDVLEGTTLDGEIRTRLTQRLPPAVSQQVSSAPPNGYRLLRQFNEDLSITVCVEETQSPF